jgi:hypothetical protein
MRVQPFVSGAVLIAGLALLGCGGGSGGGAAAPVEYHVLALHRDVALDTVRSFTVRYALTETSTLRGGEGYSSDGGGLLPQADLPFAVDASRGLTASPAWGSPVAGRMSEDGVFGAAVTVGAGNAPDLFLTVRRNPAPSLDDLVGEWFVARYVRSPGALGGSSAYCSLTEAQIGPLSNFTETGPPAFNDDGVVTGPPSLSFLASVVLLPGGWIAIEFLGSSFRGSLSADGNVLLLGSAVAGDADVWILVRRGLAQDTSQALGTHQFAGFQRSGPAFASLAGSATFAGLTGGTTSLVGNVDGTLTPPFFPDLDLYMQVSGRSVLALGALTLGGVSGPTGRYLVSIGGLTAGDEPGIYVFVR